MATTGAQDVFSAQHVLSVLVAMRGSDQQKKAAATDYLFKFQRSNDAWNIAITILQSQAEPDALLFSATTLKGKITYDLANQVPESELPALRDQVLVLLKKYAPGPKPVRVQLCVCLAILAIQMTEWKDVLPTVLSSLGNEVESHTCLLDFLRVLPEEVTEGRKINLSEDDLSTRTQELLTNNAEQVLQLLVLYAQSSPAAAQNPQLMECITSWLREIPVDAVVKSPLLDVVINALGDETSLESAAECLGTICRETRDVDDNVETIQALLPRVVALRPRIGQVADEDDIDAFKAMTRLFADAGETWVVAIAREPRHFRPLVDALLECAARDKDRDIIEYTFGFWYELKQYLVLERYIEARMEYCDVYSKLVDILVKHLQYPQPEKEGSGTDLFEGNRETEEKFREFRHHMGDTLKDCCEVMGVTDCLNKVLGEIQVWMQKYGGQATAASVPHWQELEAPIFALRAMGRMVDKHENIVLRQLMPLLVQIPPHEKLRFATIMVFARYTEWTSANPEFLEPQFTYIVSSFQTDSKEIMRAGAQAIKFFCTDCSALLSGQVVQLQTFYDQVLDKIPEMSQEEMTEGVATVVAAQKNEDIYKLLKLYCDPLVARLMAKANTATDDASKLAVADHVQLITCFVQIVVPYVPQVEENPAVKYWQEVFPILSTVVDNFLNFVPICERICRCWRFMIISYRTAMTPLLAEMANKLGQGFVLSRYGCFLWVTGAIMREFSEDREYVDQSITESIYAFFESQATHVLRAMSDLPPRELADVIEDFFRLLLDALLYFPHKLVPSPLFTPIFQAAVSALALQQRDPVCASLHYLRDLVAYGGPNPAQSGGLPEASTAQLQGVVKQLLATEGEGLVRQVMAGMMITFPPDCFSDGSGVLLGMFELLPAQTATWVDRTIRMLPAGTVTATEANRLMAKVKERLPTEPGNLRQLRVVLQDFTNSYRRRNVAPRDGLGRLEATRFHFEG